MNSQKEKYYITTPIYYPSGKWHLGHCYTTVSCDALARFKRLDGFDVFFMTGTDEHGIKIQKRAKEAGKSEQEFVDGLVGELKDIFKTLDIANDKFIRTTDPDHVEVVQKIFKTLYDKGEIYKSTYEGWYCAPCESFWTDTQLKEGKCPDCGREVTKEKEESYFFKLSKYGDKILELYKENPLFINPKSRENEMVNNFIAPGLNDLCVSRTSVKWGIPVDFDPSHTVYVWLDALTNYITGLGYQKEDDSLFQKFWPADLHMVGKEIVRFHTIIWPAILMALDLPLPKRVFGHGWLLIGGDKLSKSKLDKVRNEIVDPVILSQRYSSDAVRYFLLRDVPFGSDGVYTNEAFLNRFNTDLCNNLGNLVSRTVAMCEKYFDGIVPSPNAKEELDNELILACESLYGKVKNALDNLLIPGAISSIFDLLSKANKYIDDTTPWILSKDESKKDRLGTVIYNLLETIRISSVMLKPFLTKTPSQILKMIGATDVSDFESVKKFGGLDKGVKVESGDKLFLRIDISKELEELDAIGEAQKEINKTEISVVKKDEITIDDFGKIQLVVGEIIACEKVEKADKLLKSQVKVGADTRTVVSGIAKFYDPKALIGKKVVLVYNLKPAKLRGIESQGMILCAENEKGELSIISPDSSSFKSGSEVR